MSIRKAIRQIQSLVPERAYAIVFNHRLDAAELKELADICTKVHVKALLLTDARVVPLDQVFSVIGNTNEVEIAKALEARGETVALDVTETHPKVEVSLDEGSEWQSV